MNTFKELLKRLDDAPPEEWEREYERLPVEVERDQIYEIANTDRRYAEWLVFRFDAGPPGQALPPVEDAIKRILDGPAGTPVDAYGVIFEGPRLKKDLPKELLLASLNNAALAALKGGKTWFATWLAARAGLAAICLGAPERAWILLDLHSQGSGLHSNLDKLAIFEPIQGNSNLEGNSLVRGAIWRLWPHMEVPAVPVLPFPDCADGDIDFEEFVSSTLEALEKVGAREVSNLVQSFADSLRRSGIGEHSNHPLVRSLRAQSLIPGADGAEVDPADVPEWFVEWAEAVGRVRYEEPYLARLVGRLLFKVDRGAPALAALLVMPAARVSDLPIIEKGMPGLRALLEELKVASGSLPEPLANALIAAALPRHVDNHEGITRLEHNIDRFAQLETVEDGAVEYLVATAQRFVRDRAEQRAIAKGPLGDLIRSVRWVAARFAAGTRILPQEVHQATSMIELPELTTELLDMAVEATDELEPLERLLLALALREATDGIKGSEIFSKKASDAIFALKEPILYKLRLDLLNECIEQADPVWPMAELHYQRGCTWRLSAPEDPRMVELALTDLRTSMRLALAEGDPGMYVGAVSAWVTTLISNRARGIESVIGYDKAQNIIADALEMPMEDAERAVVLQAEAHLLREESPAQAVEAFNKALELADPSSAFWTELAAELISVLVHLERISEAVARGHEFLDRTSCATDAVELGMLHISVGQALLEAKQPNDAKQQLKIGLSLVRGRNSYIEALARLHLARTGLLSGEQMLINEHLRFFRDHEQEIPLQLRCDFLEVEASAALMLGDWNAAKSSLQEVLSYSHNPARRIRVRVVLARIGRKAVQGDAVDNELEWHSWSSYSASGNCEDTRKGRETNQSICNGELADSAFQEVELAFRAGSPERIRDQLEEAWAAVREATAYLLLDKDRREKEARLALTAAFHLAEKFAEEDGHLGEDGLVFVLSDEDSEVLARWLTRIIHEPRRAESNANVGAPKALLRSMSRPHPSRRGLPNRLNGRKTVHLG